MHRGAALWKLVTVLAVLSLQILSLVMPAVVWSQAPSTAPSTRPPVERGREYYEQSRFDEAITLLKDLVDRNALSGEDMQKARELLARSYVKKGYPAQAKDMFKAILSVDGAWRPDPIRVPPDEAAVFEQALKEHQAEAAGAPPPTTTTPPTQAAPPPTTPSTAPAAKPVPSSAALPPKEKKSLMSQWWVWALGAAVVGGVALAAGGGGGGDAEPASNELPPFPGTP